MTDERIALSQDFVKNVLGFVFDGLTHGENVRADDDVNLRIKLNAWEEPLRSLLLTIRLKGESKFGGGV